MELGKINKMGNYMFLFLFVAAYVLGCAYSSNVDVTLAPKHHHSNRKSFGGELKKLMGVIIDVNVTSPSDQIQNFTQLVMNFVDTNYKCGSEESQKIVPQIINMLQGAFKLPFIEFFIDSNAQKDVLKALEECIAKKTKRERKRKRGKKRHRNTIGETEWRAFFTGAFENAEPKDSEHGSKRSHTSNRTKKINLQSMLDDLVKGKSSHSRERSKEALMKIIFEINDYLRGQKKRHKPNLRFKSVSNRDSEKAEEADDSISQVDIENNKDVEESIYSKSYRNSMKDVEDTNNSRANKKNRKDLEKYILSKMKRNTKYSDEINDSASDGKIFRANSDTVELKTSDEVVLDQNMEITVRMDGAQGN